MKIKHVFPIAAFISCMVFVSCGQQQQGMPQAKYETMKVKTENRDLEKTFSATIRGRQDIEVYPEVSGKLTNLCVTEGQNVKKGQVLFIIDQVPYKAQVETARANVRAAEASLATAELNYKSEKNLFDKKVVSEYDLKTSENALLSAKAALAQAKAQLTIANNNLSYCSVKSPSNGVVGKLPYRLGALVGPSMPQALTTVSDNSEMYIYFSMPEKDAIETARQYGSLEKAVEDMPLISLKLSDGTVYSEKGKVETATGNISTSTGTISLRAKFPNANKFLISGATGSVIMPVSYKNVIVIPQEATYALQDKTVCYKVVDGKAKSQIINVSKISNGKEYIVLDGLKAGDEIVASGAGLVREGTQIK